MGYQLQKDFMTTQTQLKIGKIRYLNCLPFYHGLPENGFFESFPSGINEAMRRGKIDAAPVSSLEYLQHQADYLLMGPCIGARLFARSVLLLSRRKIEDLDGIAVALSRESLSSAALLRILLKGKYQFENRFEWTEQDPEAMLQEYSAALVIGDQALFCQPKELVYKYDLAELWQAWTGKPFVFAVWAVRKTVAREFPEQTAELARFLKENAQKNLSDTEVFLKEALEILPEDRRFCQLLGYFTNLEYELADDMTEGLVRYFELAHEHGLAPAPKALEFFEKKSDSH